MDTRQTRTPTWRVLWLIPVAALAAVTIIATGGSGGGGNGDDDEELPIRLLPSYNFFLTDLQGNAPLTAVVGDMFTVTVDIDGILPGGLDLSGSSTVTDVSIARLWLRETARIFLSVTSPEGSPLDGNFTVTATSEVEFGDGPFFSGSFTVSTAVETVTVTDVLFGVDIALDGGKPVSYTYEEFSDLLDDEMADAWQRRASLAFGALQFIVDQFLSVTEVLDSLEAVTFNNPAVSTCDMFTGTPPDGVLAQGEITITWLGSGELSDGDDFTWGFNQCWNADDEELIHGTVSLQDYTESIDYSGPYIFEIGFGGIGDVPGGVIFDFTVSDTVENEGVWTIPADEVITVTGGFTVTIQAP
jgi:hypothetical protein